MSIEQTYISYGIPSTWAKNYAAQGIPAATFKQTSKKNLIDLYKIPKSEVDFVKKCLQRQPIEESVIQRLLGNNAFTCCLCKGQKSDGYIIHHITEYSKTQDNTYNNLAVLCPNDHDLAHRTGVSLTNKISEDQIKTEKKNWEQTVAKENKRKAKTKPLKQKIDEWKKINPYKELQSYTESDSAYFFGRGFETTQISENLIKFGVIGLFGESGTGKTSIIQAALVPTFKSDNFITLSIRCLDEPIKRLRDELLKVLKEKKFLNEQIEEVTLTDTFPRLINQLKSLAQQVEKNFIIIIDQFEELFTRAREIEREYVAKGLNELTAINNGNQGKVYFLLSLREDYIGSLWDWAHQYNFEDAWVHQYRIKRFDKTKAYDVIVKPLTSLGIDVNESFVYKLIADLTSIGDGFIYPPYLQIVCSQLYEKFKEIRIKQGNKTSFDENLYSESAESIIADYLSESMLQGLTEDEKKNSENILNLLTGAEGLRAFLSIDDISRYISVTKNDTQHIIEHLLKKKVVHAVVESDNVVGYELVHDFLSKKFFDKLGSEARMAKTVSQIFRIAYREWKQHAVLASKDRLEILLPHQSQLSLSDEEYLFLVKSSLTVYWYFENDWIKVIEHTKLVSICISLLEDKEERIVEQSIRVLGELKSTTAIPYFIKIIESQDSTDTVKEASINQFAFNLVHHPIIPILRPMTSDYKNYKIRKAALYAFAKNLNSASKDNKTILQNEINIIFIALNDSMTQVRREVANILSYTLISEISVKPLLTRLKIESSISSRKAIVSALNSLLRKNFYIDLITSSLEEIVSKEHEDYRVKEEARIGLEYSKVNRSNSF